MSLHLLSTSADSLIAAFALSFIVTPPHVLPLILMFAACDALGAALGLTLPLANGLAAAALMACGAGLVLRSSFVQAPGWIYALPPLLAIDNVVSHASDPLGLITLSSAVMAGLGFACGAIARAWWKAAPERWQSISGACLFACGSALAFGS
jgi:hypothetical protein